MPSLIVSDNAKTFKAAERAVKKLFNQPKVKAELLTKRVTWRFNLERSPWWGGFFERMVRSVKRCLRKVLGNAKLTVDELNTVLVEIEGTLNSRPLTEEYEEFEGDVLTPSHLIYGRAINFIPRREVAREERLREFHKSGNRKARSLKEGEVVVVYGEGEKRGKWKLGKVEQLILGNDSEVRGAKLRIAGKGKPVYLKRPVQKLYPLEIQARPGGNGTEGNSPSGEAEGSLHDLHERPRRAAAEISKAKTRAMLDS
ncbi:uncharacterized protein LOC114543944 [Dendronephthya gigantea]|uniref:uncharacterized protein LOC114543944 n=1 Tax=Dendronephthya gigantea TaxID=151771 RepID=UPI00106B9C21|nr:uncharacterized protein LOC114543944 [Dendronephthya gigantea]